MPDNGSGPAMIGSVQLLFSLPCLLMNTMAICAILFSESTKRDRLRKRLLSCELWFFAFFLIDFILRYALAVLLGFDAASGSIEFPSIMKISQPVYLAFFAENVVLYFLYYSVCMVFLGLCGLDKSAQRRFVVGLPIFALGLWTSACYLLVPLLYDRRSDAPSIYRVLRFASSIAYFAVFAIISMAMGILWIRARARVEARRERLLGDGLASVFCGYFTLFSGIAFALGRIFPGMRGDSSAPFILSPYAIDFLASLAILVYVVRIPRQDASSLSPGNDAPGVAVPDPFAPFSLTPREEEIAKLVLQGLSNKEICSALGISHGTVKNHVFSIFRKLGVQSRFELTKFLGVGR